MFHSGGQVEEQLSDQRDVEMSHGCSYQPGSGVVQGISLPSIPYLM